MGNEDEKNQNNNQSNNNNQGNNNQNSSQTANNATLSLHQEELDITKNKVQTGEVTLSKTVVEEQKTVDVPVTHEEIVIERRPVNNQTCNESISCGETIRIPVAEEQVQVGKHTVTTGEVSAYKREVQQTQQISETLRKEEAQINKNGNPIITNQESNSSSNNQGGSSSSSNQESGSSSSNHETSSSSNNQEGSSSSNNKNGNPSFQ